MPSELPEYQFTKYGIAIPWEARLSRSPSEFFPNERITLKARLLKSVYESLYLEPLHDDTRYVDRFYLQGEVLESGVYDALIKVLNIKYRNILVGYGNDYLVELLSYKRDLEISKSFRGSQSMYVENSQNFDVYLIKLLLNSPASLLRFRRLVLQRFFERLSEKLDSIQILHSLFQGLPFLSIDELYKLKFIITLACKSLFFVIIKAMKANNFIIQIDLNLVISTYNLLNQLEKFNLATDYIKGILELFEL